MRDSLPGYDNWLARPYEFPDGDKDRCPECEECSLIVKKHSAWCPGCGFEDEPDYEEPGH